MAWAIPMHPAQTKIDNVEKDWPADWFETAATCLWCGSGDSDPVLNGVQDWFFKAVPGRFAFARCRDCASLFLSRRPDSAHIGAAYRQYYTHGENAVAAQRNVVLRRVWHAMIAGYARQRFGKSRAWRDKALAFVVSVFSARRAAIDAEHRFLPKSCAEVLDYGCGDGAFLMTAATLGHQVSGVDFDPQAVAVARSKRLTVYLPQAIPEDLFADRYDHVTLAHVIEHVADPVALLRDVHRWTKPGGTLFIEVPNAEAAGLSRHGRFWRGLEAPRHFSLPSEQGLRSALQQTGFDQVEFSERAFAHEFMDSASSATALTNMAVGTGAEKIAQLAGPEILVCRARKLA